MKLKIGVANKRIPRGGFSLVAKWIIIGEIPRRGLTAEAYSIIYVKT
jgi:hypothetical protein